MEGQSMENGLREDKNQVTNGVELASVNGEQTQQVEPAKSQPGASVNNASSIPDGGLMAWLQVLGSFFLFFNTWGVINMFGSYQAYYESALLKTSTPSAISWIGSIQSFLLLFVGALSGPIYDNGGFRYLLLSGTFLLVLGQMTLSACTQYWQVLLSQAICIGCGAGLLFIPSVSIISTYFSKKVGVAMGLAASGSSMGGVIYPIVFHKLLPQVGFGWTTRTLGFLILGTLTIPNLCMRTRVLPPTKRSLMDLSAFRIPAYTLMNIGFFIGFMGLYMPFFYSQLYAIQNRITNPDLAFYLLAILNSTSVFGRIIPNVISDFTGPFNVIVPCTVMSAVLCFCYIEANTAAGIIVLQAFYGFFSGTFVSIPPTIVVSLSLDARHKIGTRMGQCFACVSIGLLIGTPIGGAILDTKSGFTGTWIYGGVLLMYICMRWI
ncbi:MFS general substrate transporter [Periconia macrospinosa]|uniref:MFS general substrate transporter n=1 Tax=Periconia macrospinosa TaxID=97972 RepID=A0A2V1E3Y5_9PLEO|nr:MFS general substrate transporter [Periconia macrospinosa]